MNARISAVSLFSALAAVFFLYAAPAQAQASRTWVSGVGDDANPCSRTAPCKTFAGAISKTATNGEINCIDPAGFGTVTITKSITIDCKNTQASLLHSSVNGVNVAFDNFAGTDTRKTVRLRGLTFNGFDSGTNGIRITGGATVTGTEVFVEDVVIDGVFAGATPPQSTTARGITDVRNGGGKLFVANTVIRNLAGYGISIGPGTNVLNVSLDHVRIQNAHDNVFSTNAKVMITDSVFAGNLGTNIFAESTAQVNISRSVISHGLYGIFNNAATIRISDVDIAYNDTGISGTVMSYGNNRISGNTTPGPAPTLISPALQ